MFVTSTTNQKTQVWQKRALHCTCWDMKLCSFAVSTATQSLLFWMPGAAKRNTVCGVNGHQFGLSWSMLAEALTLCAAPLFGFSPPLGSSVWKPNLWETCCHVECRDTCDSVGTVRQEKRVYLDGVLWKFDFSWQFLPRVHVCIVAVGKLWSGGRKVVFNCLLVETFMEIFVIFLDVLGLQDLKPPCSSALLCSGVKVVRFRYWTFLGFWSRILTVSIISEWKSANYISTYDISSLKNMMFRHF